MALNPLVQDYSSHKFSTASTLIETTSLGFMHVDYLIINRQQNLLNIPGCFTMYSCYAVMQFQSRFECVLTQNEDVTLNVVAAQC